MELKQRTGLKGKQPWRDACKIVVLMVKEGHQNESSALLNLSLWKERKSYKGTPVLPDYRRPLDPEAAAPGAQVQGKALAPFSRLKKMLESLRIVPQWKELKCQLIEKLELQKGLPEATEGAPLLLSDRPVIVFRTSCFPSLMPLICFYSTDSAHYFASFTWRSTKGYRCKVRLWSYSVEDDSPLAEKDYAMREDPKILIVVHVPRRRLFVAYCEDIHLRLFSDHSQDLKQLTTMTSPYSISSMHYNSETGELMTGAIGLLAFWSFHTEEISSLSVTQEVHIASGEFVHALSMEKEHRALVALCENTIRVFDYQSKAELRAFQVRQGVSLTCCSVSWLQGFLYAGDLAGDVKVWNFDTGTQVNQFKAHLSAISSVVTRASVHSFMTASLDGMLKEWNLTTCELLRRVDIGEQLFQMQFINEQTFFLRTQHTFSIRTINNFYQLFNRANSILKKMRRVQCGPDKARILAATEDGVIRFLSSVTGEMLFVTWPFHLLEKALDYVYDPDREELLVTIGTTDIYVLDTTKNPCPTKHILHTTEVLGDKVLCLTYSCLDLNGRPLSFIFSGYKSGRVRSVTQHLYHMGGRKLHDGRVVALSSISASGHLSYHSRESSYLCSYGSDECIVLSKVLLKKNRLLDVEPLYSIPSTNCRINHLLLIPDYICVLTEQNRVRLWRQAGLLPGKSNPFWKETGTMHSTSITSFDYCHELRMLVTGGSDGSVRLWDILGQMLVEFDTSLKFSRVCFANQRGDLVVGCNQNIYFISCVSYLPSRQLSILIARSMKDDVVEHPLPFLPHFLLSFDIIFVPKYHQVGKQAQKYEHLQPITNHKEVAIESNMVKVMEFVGTEASTLPPPDFYGVVPVIKETHPEFAKEYLLLRQPTPKPAAEKKKPPAEPPLAPPPRVLPPVAEKVPLLRRIPFQTGRTWPMAPDGYIPNSVIRAQLFPKGTPEALQCTVVTTRYALPMRKMVKVQLPEWEKDDLLAVERFRKKKTQRLKVTSGSPLGAGLHRDLLTEIVSKPWLRHKPSEVTLPSITKAILALMDDVPYSTYMLCTAALVQMSEAYELPPAIREEAFNRLMQDTNHKEVRMRLAAWETLGKMDLLTDKEVVPLARALLDESKKVRDLARSLLDSVAGITDKYVLKKEMQRLRDSSLEDLTELSQCSVLDSLFPHRGHAELAIIADLPEEAGDPGVAEGLLDRVETQLTANLFLMSECRPSDRRSAQKLPQRKKRASAVTSETMEEAEPEAHGEAQARWLGLFDQGTKKPQGAVAIEAAKRRHKTEKLPKLPPALGITVPSSEYSSKAGSSSSSTSLGGGSSSSGASWQEVWTEKKRGKAKERRARRGTKISASPPSQEAPKLTKLPKLSQPIPLQRRDTRTQLYSEMLKRQHVKREPLITTTPVDSKPESPMGLEQVSLPVPVPSGVPLTPTKGSLIDPKQQYSADKSKWRDDLYKLLTLRLAPMVEGRPTAEDLLASAKLALGGPILSWEDFATVSQSLLASQEKMPTEQEGWRKHMDDLLKASAKESWHRSSTESAEKVASAGTKGTKRLSGSETDWERARQQDRAAGERKADRERKTIRKMIKPPKQEVGEKGGVLGKKEVVDDKEERGAEKGERLETRQEQELAKGKERDVSRVAERELAKQREQEVVERKGKETFTGKARELAAKKKGKELAETQGERAEEQKAMQAKRREEQLGEGRERAWAETANVELAEVREQAVAEVSLAEKAKVLAERREKALAERREKALVERRKKVLDEARKTALAEVRERALEEAQEMALAEVREMALAEVRETALAEAREMALAEVRETALAEAREMALAEVRETALAEAREMALAEVRETALAEAREMALAEVREMALAEVRETALAEAQEMALAEVRETALAEAQEMALAEVRETALAEARQIALAAGREVALAEGRVGEEAEVRAKELAEERLSELAEVRARELAEERIRELAETRATELAEERIRELAERRIRELAERRARELAEVRIRELVETRATELAEERIRELAERRIRELAERRARELAEVRIRELVETRATELAEERLRELVETRATELAEERLRELAEARATELAEERIRKLAEARATELAEERIRKLAKERIRELAATRARGLAEERIRELVETRATELAEERLRELAEARATELAEVRVREVEIEAAAWGREGAEADIWEEIEEEQLQLLSAEEKEALIAMWQEDFTASRELDILECAELLLDILSEPEKLEATDSKTLEHLFRVVSLLQIPTTVDTAQLAEFLLDKADEIVKKGEETQECLAEQPPAVLEALRKAVAEHRLWDTDAKEHARRKKVLLMSAQAMLRARALKEKLKRDMQEPAWWGTSEKAWQLQGEGKVMSKKAWMDQKVRDAMEQWQDEQFRVEQLRRQRERHLHFRAHPIILGEPQWTEVKEEKEQEEEEEEEEVDLAFAGAHQKQPKVMWSLGRQRERAWKAIVTMEEPPPITEASDVLRPKRYRLLKGSLYMPGRALRAYRSKFRRVNRPHILRLAEKIDWETFTTLYQSLAASKEEEGGVESAAWQEQFSKVLDLYGLNNPLIQTMMQQLLLGDHRKHKHITGRALQLSKAQANLGQRILYEVVQHSSRVPSKLPALHRVIPLSYQNNVHPFRLLGITHFGTMSLKWKTLFSMGQLPKLHLYVHSQGHSK